MEKQLIIPTSIADNLPSMVKAELANMSSQHQQNFVEAYRRKKKSISVGYIFHLFIFSAFYGYRGKWGMQILYWLTGAGFFIWWLILLFAIPGSIKSYNKDVAIDVMRNIKILQ